MESRELVAALREMAAFHKLEDRQLERLASRAVVFTIARNTVFHSEEREAKGLHVLLSGLVKLFKVSDEGKEQTLFLFRPGEPFCLCSVFSDGKLPAHVAALEDSRVLYIHPDEVARLAGEDPTLLLNLLRIMARRLKDAMDMIDALSLKQLPSRLAAFFLASTHEGEVRLDITFRELSKIVGATPEAVSRALKRMLADGLLSQEGRTMRVLRPEALREVAEGRARYESGEDAADGGD